MCDEFYIYEINEIICQKEDLRFAIALNNLASGTLREDDTQFKKSKETLEDTIPCSAIRLFPDNKSIDNSNNIKISSFFGIEYLSIASDSV